MTPFHDEPPDARHLSGALLLSRLEDPFNTFPLNSVARELATLVDDAESRRARRSGWWGVSPAFHSVEDEHDIDVSTLLVGSAFVLVQGTIEESVSIVRKLSELDPNAPWFPRKKGEMMSFEARIHAATGISEVALINAVANYTKHHHEWPDDWMNPSGGQRSTVDAVHKLGLRPGLAAGNLDLALRELGAASSDLQTLAKTVIGWRESMAKRIRAKWSLEEPEW